MIVVSFRTKQASDPQGDDGLKWLKPVRPGDKLSGTAKIMGVRISKSRPELGFVTHVATLKNDASEDVYILTSTSIVKSRSGGPS